MRQRCPCSSLSTPCIQTILCEKNIFLTKIHFKTKYLWVSTKNLSRRYPCIGVAKQVGLDRLDNLTHPTPQPDGRPNGLVNFFLFFFKYLFLFFFWAGFGGLIRPTHLNLLDGPSTRQNGPTRC